MLVLYSFTLFLSAFLLFWVQLMAAKMILPLLGGSPSVWNTCQFFFQATLLLGYGYSHLTTTWWKTRRQAIAHGFLLFAPLVFLPIAVSKTWLPPREANPIPWLIALLIASVGLPFFVVSTTAPLLQKWFADTEHPSSNDPYFLYSASNLGSLLGLFSYPILIEPNFSLSRQSSLWAIAYGLLIVLTLGCAVFLWKQGKNLTPQPPSLQGKGENFSSFSPPLAGEGLGERLTLKQKLQWVLLAFIPSSLLLGVTTYLTTDLAAVPLLWAIPLAIYLLTFILTFARNPRLPHQTFVTLSPLLLTALVLLSLLKILQPLWLLLPLHLLGFFVAACIFHGELARSRPIARHLTSFYLWISAGGVLGGLFNAIAAPVLFPSVQEYPLILLLGILMLQSPAHETTAREEFNPFVSLSAATGEKPDPQAIEQMWLEMSRQKEQAKSRQFSVFKLTLQNTRLVSLGLLFGALLVGFNPHGLTNNLIGNFLAFTILAGLYYAFNLGGVRLTSGLILIFLLSQFSIGNLGGVLDIDRSFFGVNRVVQDRRGEYHSLLHGTTLHGKQSLAPERRREPLTYFYRTGPIGQVFQSLNASDRLSNVAVLGLGIGTLAAYAEPGQTWTFYEIDPAVEKLARNPQYFTFLQDSKAPFSIVLGDARLRLADVPDNSYDLLVMDAFSSDSIPVHLVTREAIALYLSKLTQRGLLAVNISNRYINLEPVLGALARELGLASLRQLELNISPDEKALGKSPSHWVLLGRSRQDFGTLNKDARWQPVADCLNAPLWTDDFSDIFRVLRAFER